MNKYILVAASIFGLIGVLLGAFAAHGLAKQISPESINTFETGVRYQIYYAFLLLVIGLSDRIDEKYLKWVFYLTVFGVILFSGSIYGLATNALTAFNFKSVAIITPIGGVMLISVWAILLINFIKKK